jgi:hypothetical protein
LVLLWKVFIYPPITAYPPEDDSKFSKILFWPSPCSFYLRFAIPVSFKVVHCSFSHILQVITDKKKCSNFVFLTFFQRIFKDFENNYVLHPFAFHLSSYPYVSFLFLLRLFPIKISVPGQFVPLLLFFVLFFQLISLMEAVQEMEMSPCNKKIFIVTTWYI